jgi:hypothetical protein
MIPGDCSANSPVNAAAVKKAGGGAAPSVIRGTFFMFWLIYITCGLAFAWWLYTKAGCIRD